MCVILNVVWECSGSYHIPWEDGWDIFKVIPIVLIVYTLIVAFVSWYIDSEIGNIMFNGLISIFGFGIIIFLVGKFMSLVVSWESISLISFLLIGFWVRNEAKSSAIAAVMYNRFSDFFIIIFVLGYTGNWILLIVAVIGNSAIWILSYWLPIAIEGPTPVSSLLHSSTMVVAGVTLGMLCIEISLVVPFIGIVLVSLFMINWFDANNMIAFSTAVHLSIIILSISMSIYALVLIHIITHSFVKASAFVASGVVISSNGSQDTRVWGMNYDITVMTLAFMLLSSVSGSLVFNSNEFIVIQMVALLIISISWAYTNIFFSNLSWYNDAITMIPYSSALIIVIGGSSFVGVDILYLVIITVLALFLVNSSSGYVVNN